MDQFPVNQVPSKKIYQQPQLKTYGDLRHLTQGGSKGITEYNTPNGVSNRKV